MPYLLDANVLIDANMYYYPIDRVPDFWRWLAEMGKRGLVKVPREIFDEIVRPRPEDPDAVIEWLMQQQDALLFEEDTPAELLTSVVEEGYGNALTDVEIEKIGRDPFLIAYALVDKVSRCVVSNEASKPSQQRANRRVPDVCRHFDVRCIKIFELIRELDFRTG